MQFKMINIFKILKKMMLLTFLIFPSFIFPTKNTEIGRRAIESFGKKIRKEKNWTLSGSGGSFYNPEKIVLNVHFDVCGPHTLPESRKLIIETAEDFIKFVNRERKYLKIFKNNKFSQRNIELTIMFKHEITKQTNDDACVKYVSLINEHLHYYYRTEPDKHLFLRENEVETYEQARAIVLQEKSTSQ